jgi:hypothetical protein
MGPQGPQGKMGPEGAPGPVDTTISTISGLCGVEGADEDDVCGTQIVSCGTAKITGGGCRVTAPSSGWVIFASYPVSGGIGGQWACDAICTRSKGCPIDTLEVYAVCAP